MTGLIFHADGQPDWHRAVPLGVMAASVVALGSAYVAEYGFGLKPCVLCLYQRVPYGLAGVLALAALSFPRGATRANLVAGCAFLFLIGGGIAFYHVGVEQHWWASAAGCGGTLPLDMSASDLRAALMEPPDPACDAPSWTFLGLSMATWNVPVSLALAGLAWHGFTRMRGRKG